MELDDLQYFMDIARTFNNVPKNGKGLELSSFDADSPPLVDARHFPDGELQYVLINSKFNQQFYTQGEMAYLMGVFVHEYRYIWQEYYDDSECFKNEINETDYNTYHETWIQHEYEQDAEAIKYLFYTDVLKVELKNDKKFNSYDKKIQDKIIEYMQSNKSFVNVKGAIEKIKASEEPFEKYIKET